MANKSIIEAPSVKVGVGVFVFRSRDDPHFCIGVRKASHGAGELSRFPSIVDTRAEKGKGTWSLPGGHLEFGETFEQCATREIAEETGLELEHVRYLTAVESMFAAERKHYVTIFMVAIAKAGTDGAVIEARVWVPHFNRSMSVC